MGITNRHELEWETCVKDQLIQCSGADKCWDTLDDYVSSWTLCNDKNIEVPGCGECSPDPVSSELYSTLQCLVKFDEDHHGKFMSDWDTCKKKKLAVQKKEG